MLQERLYTTIMATIIIKEDSPQAKKFLEFVRTLPFATILEQKRNFREAADECNAVSVDTFIDELKTKIEKWPEDNA